MTTKKTLRGAAGPRIIGPPRRSGGPSRGYGRNPGRAAGPVVESVPDLASGAPATPAAGSAAGSAPASAPLPTFPAEHGDPPPMTSPAIARTVIIPGGLPATGLAPTPAPIADLLTSTAAPPDPVAEARRVPLVRRAALILEHLEDGLVIGADGRLPAASLRRLASLCALVPSSPDMDPDHEARRLWELLVQERWILVTSERAVPGPAAPPCPRPGEDPEGFLRFAHRLLVAALARRHLAAPEGRSTPSPVADLVLDLLPLACRPRGVVVRDPWGAEVARALWEIEEERLVDDAQSILEETLEELMQLRESGILGGEGLRFTGTAAVLAASRRIDALRGGGASRRPDGPAPDGGATAAPGDASAPDGQGTAR